MIHRKIILVLLSLTLSGIGSSDLAGQTLRVGMDLSYPPFETIGPDGEPRGVSVEIAKGLAAELDRPLHIENIPFTGLIPALKSGKIDLIISSMTATAERAKAVTFSTPYLTTGLGALVPVNSPVARLADLDRKGRTVVVRQGTTGEVFARKYLQSAQILALDKESACVMEVAQGKADAFLYDQMSVFQNAKRNPDTTKALLAPMQTESWAIALAHGDNSLLASVNAFLAKYRSEGGFDQLAEQFLAEEKAAFAAQGIPFLF